MDQPPPMSESPPATPPAPPATSIWSRLTNVLVEPGAVFEEVKASAHSAANWLLPVALLSAAGVIAAFVMFSQPNIIQKIHEQQAKAIDKQVEAGKLTRAQADQALAMAEKFTGPTMMTIFGSVGAVILSFIRVFWWGLILWLISKIFLKQRIGYRKAVEVAGLTQVIILLNTVVGTLLIVCFGKLGATPSLALALGEIDFNSKVHLLMAAANVFYFWQVAVLSIGLARLSGASVPRALAFVGGYWLVTELLLIACGLGQFAI